MSDRSDASQTSQTKVVLFYARSLFAAGVESRLHEAEGLLITRLDASQPESLAMLGELAPDVIIVDTHDADVDAGGMIPEILNSVHSAKVIGLDLNSDELNIYLREGRSIKNGADLAALIRSQKRDEPGPATNR